MRQKEKNMKEEKQVGKKTEKKTEKKVEAKAEKKVVKKVKAEAEKKVEKKVEAEPEKKVEKIVEQKVEEKPKKKVTKKAEAEPEKKVEKIVEQKVEEKPKKKVAKKAEAESEKKTEEKVEEKIEEKPKKKTAKKVKAEAEKEPAEEVEEKVEKKPKKRVSKKVKAKAEKEAEEENEEDLDEKPGKKGPKKKPTRIRKGAVKLENILDLNATNIWDLDEYDIADAWERGREVEDFTISEQKLLNIIRLVFDVVHFDPENEREAAKFVNGGWEIITHCQEAKGCVAIRRRAIERITDLSYENIRHISTAMLLELINRNFGGGWDSISLSIRDIIERGFEISTTQLPQSRIHAPGGTVEKKIAQGFDVLEIPKGTWVEAIFAKKKDPVEKIHMELPEPHDEDLEGREDFDEDDENLDNDDTFYSSLTPEEDVKELEEEGLSIEDIEEEGEEE